MTKGFWVDIFTESFEQAMHVTPLIIHKEHPSKYYYVSDGRAAVMAAIEDSFTIVPDAITWYECCGCATVHIEHDNGNTTDWFFTPVEED